MAGQKTTKSIAEKKEKQRVRDQLKYLHNKNDPEKAEKMRLSWRTSKAKSYIKKKENPEEMEAKREYDRAFKQEKTVAQAKAKAKEREGFSVDMIETPTVAQLQQHETQPTIDIAQALLWQISGGDRFRDARNLVGSSEEERILGLAPIFYPLMDATKAHSLIPLIACEKLKKEIEEEALTDADIARCLEEFHKSINNAMTLPSCGACGIRCIGLECFSVSLDDLECLQLKEAQLVHHRSMGDYGAVSSIFVRNDGVHFFLHPEVVTEGEGGSHFVSLCQECLSFTKEGEIPPYSVASGLDFGDITRLPNDLSFPALTHVEQILVSPVRIYSSIIKLTPSSSSGSALKGHIISFRQDGPEKAAAALTALPDLSALSSIQVAFVGSKKEWEFHRKGALKSPNLRVRPQVIHRFLRMKKEIDLQYAGLEIKDEKAITAEFGDTAERLMAEVVLILDDQSVRIDKILHADVAGVRTLDEEDGSPPLSVSQQLGPSSPHGHNAEVNEGGDEDEDKDKSIVTHVMLTKRSETSEIATARLLSSIHKTIQLKPSGPVSPSRRPLNPLSPLRDVYRISLSHLLSPQVDWMTNL
jgi:hypothetical protein